MTEPLKMLDYYPADATIARYIYDNYQQIRIDSQGCDGFGLWRHGDNYLYIWLEAMVNRDVEYHYLVEVRETLIPPGEGETRHYLYVAYSGLIENGLVYDTLYEFITFPGATFREARQYQNNGLRWFVDKVIETEARNDNKLLRGLPDD